ncbi:MAG TPA: hypothetical protein VHF50_04365 [Solirubrobacterales bacterium]|nr:hypothetical protein [Solirubrobacterales bacterium]
MASSERIYRGSVRAFSAVFVVIGLTLLVVTVVNGGGPLSIGVWLGVAFVAVGFFRGWVGRDRPRGRTKP